MLLMNGRQDWCCKHEHVGCASHESYDCSPRLRHWDRCGCWDEARPLQSPWGRWCLSCFGLVLSQFSIVLLYCQSVPFKNCFFYSPCESSSKQLDHQTWANSTIKAAHNIVILSHDRWILLVYVGMTDIWQLVFPCMSPGKMIPLDWYL